LFSVNTKNYTDIKLLSKQPYVLTLSCHLSVNFDSQRKHHIKQKSHIAQML